MRADLEGFLSLDRVVHEPARLVILTVLAQAEEVEFRFLERVSGLTKGNLSSHISRPCRQNEARSPSPCEKRPRH